MLLKQNMNLIHKVTTSGLLITISTSLTNHKKSTFLHNNMNTTLEKKCFNQDCKC